MRLWLGTLSTLAGVLSGGLVLQRSGRTRLGISFLLILAVPGVLAGLFFLAMIIINPRWNLIFFHNPKIFLNSSTY
jgi:hypothetical protein